MAQAKDKSKRPPAKMPQKGMHMMPGSKMPMKDSEMNTMMSPDLKARYPSMVKKGKKK